ncbi:MAG TPA: hypothetical protein VJB05_02405 [archaeon]|nr:hypothetical protein [archaeon]
MDDGQIRKRMEAAQQELALLGHRMDAIEAMRDQYDPTTYSTIFSSYRAAAAALDRDITRYGFDLQEELRRY